MNPKLVKRWKDWYLFITFRKEKEKKKAKKGEGLTTEGENKEGKKEEEFKVTGIVAVDANQDFLTVGNDKQIIEIPTRLDDAYHYMEEVQKIQKKYPTKWRYSKKILNRIAHFFRRERNILVDFAKKAGKWIVDIALLLKANVIVLEKLTKMINHVDDLRKNYRLILYLMQYRRIQKWIEWQAKKYGLKVIKVNPAYSSTTCPKCGILMKESEYRTFRCPNCGFEENRDYIAVLNLYWRGSLHLSIAHGMKGGKNHSDRENPRS